MNEPFTTMTAESFHHIFVTNAGGVLFAVQKALPLFRDGGPIVLNASIAHVKGMAGASAYCVRKAAVRSFARTWAMELKDCNIRVNVISPGPIETPFTDPAPAAMERRDDRRCSVRTIRLPEGKSQRPRCSWHLMIPVSSTVSTCSSMEV